ncbi:MAG: hypothetical protein WAQ05_18925 [Rubrivivax sp.]
MTMKTLAAAATWGLLATATTTATTAQAQGFPLGDSQRTWFEPQLLLLRSDVTRRESPVFSSGAGSDVSLEDDLKLPQNRAAGGIGFGRRIGANWRFEIDYLRSQRSGDTTLTRNLQIGDFLYSAGTPVSSTATFQFARIVGGMSVLRTDDAEFGFVVGGALPRLRLSLRTASLGTTTWVTADAVPMLGLFYSGRLAPNLQFSGRLEGGSRDGSNFVNVSANVVWRPSPHVGVGAGWRMLSGRANSETLDVYGSFDERMDFRLGGPQLFANLSF